MPAKKVGVARRISSLNEALQGLRYAEGTKNNAVWLFRKQSVKTWMERTNSVEREGSSIVQIFFWVEA